LLLLLGGALVAEDFNDKKGQANCVCNDEGVTEHEELLDSEREEKALGEVKINVSRYEKE